MTPRRYLVVDDNVAFAENVAEILRDDGAEVEVAHTGPEALQRATPGRFDALVIDMRMPGMSGAELLRAVRRQDPGVPVVWLACIVMMAGLYITFFVAHQRVWVRVEKDRSSPTVLAAGTTSRNPVAFERDFEAMVAELKASLKGKGQ